MKIVKWNKKPISKPGIYSGIPIDVYHSKDICDGPSVSSTGLRLLWQKSPAHFWYEWRCNPEAVRTPPTKPMILGSAAHHLFLGEDDFDLRFVAQPRVIRDEDGDLVEWSGNRKVCKQWLKDQEKAKRMVLKTDQFEMIRGMRDALARDPLVKAGALNGEIECSMFWRDEETGIWLCGRPDAIPVSDGDFSDLKTGESVDDLSIFRALRSYGLNMQGALIWEIAEKLKLPFASFNLIFVETSPPHCVRVVPMKGDDLSIGRRQNRAMLHLIAECISRNEWPGPGFGDPRTIGLPQGEREYIETRLEAMGV